jgi:tetratricopeptide (TPR) repeat protein
MKKLSLVIAAVAVLLGTNAFAQGKYGADSAECIKYLSYYKEYFKQKNYDESLPSWRKAYKICPPTASQNLLIDGTTLLRRLVTKNAKNPEYKAALLDSLLTIHDVRAQYYPKYAVTSLNNKAVDVSNYLKDDSRRAYDIYTSVIEANGKNTKPTVYIFAFNSALELYNAGKMDAASLISLYQDYMDLIDGTNPAKESDKEQLASVKADLESLFISSKVASCEDLIALFTPRYEANPTDNALVSNIVKIMSITEDCTDNDLYLKAVTSMHKNNPTYTSAYFLYRVNSSHGLKDEAVKYLEEAISYPDCSEAQKGEYNYELATYCFKNGMSAKAFAAAQLAATQNSEYTGKAYFLIANIWGSTVCGGDDVARRAPYWVAVDYLQKAKNADPSLAEEANKLIGSYASYYPQTAEAFMYDVTDGQSYTVSCGGMRATTVVRTQK